MAKKPVTDEQRQHWSWVRAFGCLANLLTRGQSCGKPATIHHCHGGSMKDRGIHKSLGGKTSHWLVVPLCPDHHTGKNAIDGFQGVRAWEDKHGEQAKLLDMLARRCGRDLFALAHSEDKPVPERADLVMPYSDALKIHSAADDELAKLDDADHFVEREP